MLRKKLISIQLEVTTGLPNYEIKEFAEQVIESSAFNSTVFYGRVVLCEIVKDELCIAEQNSGKN